jgi:hypothetical protein
LWGTSTKPGVGKSIVAPIRVIKSRDIYHVTIAILEREREREEAK